MQLSVAGAALSARRQTRPVPPIQRWPSPRSRLKAGPPLPPVDTIRPSCSRCTPSAVASSGVPSPASMIALTAAPPSALNCPSRCSIRPRAPPNHTPPCGSAHAALSMLVSTPVLARS